MNIYIYIDIKKLDTCYQPTLPCRPIFCLPWIADFSCSKTYFNNEMYKMHCTIFSFFFWPNHVFVGLCLKQNCCCFFILLSSLWSILGYGKKLWNSYNPLHTTKLVNRQRSFKGSRLEYTLEDVTLHCKVRISVTIGHTPLLCLAFKILYNRESYRMDEGEIGHQCIVDVSLLTCDVVNSSFSLVLIQLLQLVVVGVHISCCSTAPNPAAVIVVLNTCWLMRHLQ